MAFCCAQDKVQIPWQAVQDLCLAYLPSPVFTAAPLHILTETIALILVSGSPGHTI